MPCALFTYNLFRFTTQHLSKPDAFNLRRRPPIPRCPARPHVLNDLLRQAVRPYIICLLINSSSTVKTSIYFDRPFIETALTTSYIPSLSTRSAGCSSRATRGGSSRSRGGPFWLRSRWGDGRRRLAEVRLEDEESRKDLLVTVEAREVNRPHSIVVWAAPGAV